MISAKWKRRAGLVALGALSALALPPVNLVVVLWLCFPLLLRAIDQSENSKIAFGRAWLFGLGILILFIGLITYLVVTLFLIIPVWRIFARAGFGGAWSLLLLLPVLGHLIIMAILAFGDWPNGEAAARCNVAT